jgi:flagellar hook-associated protein 3 FlgL
MRISTQSFYGSALAAMLDQQAVLSRTQNQVATGKRVNTPADDPVAAVHILELERAQSESDQFAKNAEMARSRLNLEEQALADTGMLLQRVRELTLQSGNTATLSDADRLSVATELSVRRQELQDIANRKDGAGDYLFSGFASLTQPFSTSASGGISYAGDQGVRVLQVGPSQRVADGHSGFDVFMSVPEGNGTFVTAASATNTGSGVIDNGSVLNRAAWVPGDYTLTFTSATNWQVVDASNAVVTGGTYVSGSTIAFNGIQLSVSGNPAAGDSFSIDASGSQDIFATLDAVISALRTPATTPAGQARLQTSVSGSLQQLDQSMDHLLGIRAQVGSRLSLLDGAESARETLKVDIAGSLAGLKDLDYAEALTRMNQQLVGLQAAQQSYIKIAQLSLFNYL